MRFGSPCVLLSPCRHNFCMNHVHTKTVALNDLNDDHPEQIEQNISTPCIFSIKQYKHMNHQLLNITNTANRWRFQKKHVWSQRNLSFCCCSWGNTGANFALPKTNIGFVLVGRKEVVGRLWDGRLKFYTRIISFYSSNSEK